MLFVVSIGNLKTKIYDIFSKKQFFLLFAIRLAMRIKKIFEKEKSVEILKILGFIKKLKEKVKLTI